MNNLAGSQHTYTYCKHTRIAWGPQRDDTYEKERSASMYCNILTAIWRVRHHYCHSDPEYHPKYPANNSSNHQKVPATICFICKWVRQLLIRHKALHLECTQIQVHNQVHNRAQPLCGKKVIKESLVCIWNLKEGLTSPEQLSLTKPQKSEYIRVIG